MKSLEKERLEIGSTRKLLVREEEIGLPSHSGKSYRILYASDIHFSGERSRQLIGQLMEAAEKARPDLILFGGDLVDNSFGLGNLEDCVRELVSFAPIASVAGNHDQMVGVRQVRKSVEKSGGFWLGRDSFYFEMNGKKMRVDGRLKPERNANETKLLCAHFPDLFPRAAEIGYSLVLAGHLHGCQFVFWEKEARLYPGAWFYRWNGLRFKNGPCSLLVSRGISDSFPVRWNCPREVLLCKVY